MCELFGLSGRKKMNIVRELEEFYSHAPGNPDGWGLFCKTDSSLLFDKENIRADRSSHLKSLLSGNIEAKDAIAHIRLATIGYDKMENTHPFKGYDLSANEWIFAHNGTIFESEALTKYTYEQDGDTDSERIFLYMLDCLNKAIRKKQGALTSDERFEVLDRIVCSLSPENKLNLLIFDGEMLYVHTNFKASLFMMQTDLQLLFSTKPLSSGNWKEIPFTQLLSFKEGQLIRKGTRHGNEYIPDQCSINALYLAYSGL